LRAQGQREPAKEKFRAALAIAERLVGTEPRNTRLQTDLTIFQEDIAYVLQLQGDLAGALEYYQSALTTGKRLAEAAPDNKDLQSRLAYAHTTIGLLRRFEKNFDAALAAYREAVAIQRSLAATDPSNVDWRINLSLSLSAVGELLILRGDSAEGKMSVRESLYLIESTARFLEDKERASGGSPTFFTARAYLSIGWRALLVGEFEQSLTASERALAIMPGLVKASRNRAFALMMLDRTEDARQAYREISSLGDADDFKPSRQMLLDLIALLRKAGCEHPLMNEVSAQPILAKE
jgi:tetratricopeptide (TPR) repeat protein